MFSSRFALLIINTHIAYRLRHTSTNTSFVFSRELIFLWLFFSNLSHVEYFCTQHLEFFEFWKFCLALPLTKSVDIFVFWFLRIFFWFWIFLFFFLLSTHSRLSRDNFTLDWGYLYAAACEYFSKCNQVYRLFCVFSLFIFPVFWILIFESSVFFAVVGRYFLF